MASMREALLQIFPSNMYEQMKYIYERVPGTVVKYLNVDKVQRRFEWQDTFSIDGKLDKLKQIRNTSRTMVSVSVTPDNGKIKEPSSSFGQLPKSPVDTYSNPYETEVMQSDHDPKHWDMFRQYFLNSLIHHFQVKQIRGLDPKQIGDEILRLYQCNCFHQEMNDKRSSSPIQIQLPYVCNEGHTHQVSGTCRIAADIILESSKARLSKHQTNIIYWLTIDLDGFSVDLNKVQRFREMISKDDVSTIMRTIEEARPLTWESFMQKK